MTSTASRQTTGLQIACPTTSSGHTAHIGSSKRATGMVVSGFLVEVQKVTDEEMAGWKRDYPEAFEREREYDPATGVSAAGWIKDQTQSRER